MLYALSLPRRPFLYCRNKERAEALAAALPAGSASVADWADLQSGAVSADVLANSTSVGMVPDVDDTPVATEAVKNVSGSGACVARGGDGAVSVDVL